MKRVITMGYVLAVSTFGVVEAAEPENIHYASSDELKLELVKRREDIRRTEARIDALLQKERDAEWQLKTAKADGKRAEAIAMERTRIYYTITNNGGALRFILNASSVVDMLKRAALMKRLFTEGLEARREAGLRIAAAEQKLVSIQADKEAASKMYDMLKNAMKELSYSLEDGEDER
jgi:hypothetical protein